jgi:hypothetical protein
MTIWATDAKLTTGLSCKDKAQTAVARGFFLLHSFEYEWSRLKFQEAIQSDPDCALAWCGKAMTYNRTIWNPPSKEDLSKAWAAMDKAGNAKRANLRAYSTPLLIRDQQKEQLIVNSNPRIDSYDPQSGKWLWHAGGFCKVPVPMPVFADGVLYSSRGYSSGPYMAISTELNGISVHGPCQVAGNNWCAVCLLIVGLPGTDLYGVRTRHRSLHRS